MQFLAANQTKLFRSRTKRNGGFASFWHVQLCLGWCKGKFVGLILPFQMERFGSVPLIVNDDPRRLASFDFLWKQASAKLMKSLHRQRHLQLGDLIRRILTGNTNRQWIHARFALRRTRQLDDERHILRRAW